MRPGFILLTYFGYEIFTIPDGGTLALLVVNGLSSLVLNWLLMWGISYTSPLFVRTCKPHQYFSYFAIQK